MSGYCIQFDEFFVFVYFRGALYASPLGTRLVIFIIAWTPYALVSFYSALIVPNGVGPVYSLLPAICAKTSMLWSSLFFLASNYSFKHANAAAKSDKTLTSLKSSAYEMAAAAKNHTKCPLELRSSRA